MIHIHIYPSFCFCDNLTDYESRFLKGKIGYKVKSNNFSKSKQYFWKSIFVYNAFPTGLIKFVVDVLNKEGIKFTLITQYTPYKFDDNLLQNRVQGISSKFNLRKYQFDGVEYALKKRRLIWNLACAAGKTIMSLEFMDIALSLGLRIMYVVPFQAVLHQLIEKIEREFDKGANRLQFVKVSDSLYTDTNDQIAIGLPISILNKKYGDIDKGNRKQSNKNIVSYSEVVKRYFANIDKIDKYDKYDILIVDEAHLLGADSLFAVSSLSDAKIRIGMTATPVRTDGKDIFINSAIHTDSYVVNRNTLLEGNYIPNTTYQQMTFNTKKVIDSSKNYSECYTDLHLSDEFNDFITKIVKTKLSKDMFPTLLLTTSVDQAKLLASKLDTISITGSEDYKYRAECIHKLKTRQIDILVASEILSVGFDCPNLKSLIICGGQESEALVVQKFGRLDRNFEGKDRPPIIDINHTWKWFKNHSKTRYSLANKYFYNLLPTDDTFYKEFDDSSDEDNEEFCWY